LETNWNKTKAAIKLRVSRMTLYPEDAPARRQRAP
jgi:hypothetical protein